MTRKTFGVGCFSFENPSADHLTLENQSGTYAIQDWATDVESCLKQIPSINHIRVLPPRGVVGGAKDKLLASLGLEGLDDQGRSNELGAFVPHPSGGSISFHVSIPKHVQESVFPRPVRLAAELFEVDIVFDGPFPVAFISTPEPEESPSHAVMIVREFLEDEFAQRRDRMRGVSFSYMGPSPMWLNANITEREGVPGEAFEVEHKPRRGYDELDFFVPPGSLPDAYPAIQSALSDEIGLFYRLITERYRSGRLRMFLDFQIGEQIRLHRTAGLKAWLRRNFLPHYDAVNIRLDIAAVSQDIKLNRSSLVESVRELNEGHGPWAIGSFIEREIRQSEDTDDFVGMAEMAVVLETSRSRQAELATIALSAVGGGAVGATLTAWLSSIAGG